MIQTSCWWEALEHGQAVAKPRGGDRHSGKIEAHGGFIRELIAEQDRPDVLRQRQHWFDDGIDLEPERLVFIDET